jgi:hypothetical protein
MGLVCCAELESGDVQPGGIPAGHFSVSFRGLTRGLLVHRAIFVVPIDAYRQHFPE